MIATMPEPFSKTNLQPMVHSNLKGKKDLKNDLAQMQEYVGKLQQALELELALRRIIETIHASLDEAHILKTAVQALAMELEAGCYAILQTDTEQQLFTSNSLSQSVSGFQPNTIFNSHIFNSHIDQQLQTENYLQFCFYTNLSQEKLTLFACPIIHDNENLGSLWIIREVSRTLTDSELHLIQQVAKQCAIAIHQSRLYQAAQKQVEALKHLNEAKDNFLSQVTHDLRAPLSNMRLAIHMLARQLTAARSQCGHFSEQNPVCSKTLTHLEVLQTECEREIALINDLLDLQRLESGQQPLDAVDAIDLKHWLPEQVQPFVERIQQRKIILDLHIAPHLPILVSNSASLQRVLSELLHNACKYTPPHQTISLKVSYHLKQIQIQVSNSGVEIPHEELPRIFDKFYRIPGSDRWKQGGTGLGLSLVKETITHLGGSIHVESRQGQTCFAIQLPLQPSA